MEVGKTLWISTEDQRQCPKSITQCPDLEDEDGWMDVKWVKGRKKSDPPAYFPAKVLLFGGKLWNFCFLDSTFFLLHVFGIAFGICQSSFF